MMLNELQWGRVGEDAEMYSVNSVGRWIVVLQWGRVGEDAEISPFANVKSSRVSLQWGRVGEDAEIRLPVYCSAISS